MSNSIYKTHAEALRNSSYQSRPVIDKACKLKGWQRSDTEIPSGELESWSEKYANHGIGILLGSKFPDGTLLGALDIDHDDYVRAAYTLLGHPPCGRIGAKGIAYLVRVKGDIGFKKFDIKCDDGTVIHIGELLCQKRLLVLPPTIHPNTNRPWPASIKVARYLR